MAPGERVSMLFPMTGEVWLRGAGRIAGGVLVAATLLPLVRTNRWWVRGFDFPRLQVGGAAALGALWGGLMCRRMGRGDRALAALLAGAAAAQAVQIFPYTPLAKVEVVGAGGAGKGRLRILTANVLQENRETTVLKEFIAQREPDVILLTETDEWWERQLRGLETDYPYVVKQAQPNTYGMLLYSKLELVAPQVRFLVKDDIPSIRSLMKLRDGSEITFFGVHPEPPGTMTKNGDIRGSGPRDVELVLVAKEVEKVRGPVVVAGDFNDVAWSHTTRLFKRISRLLDPRVGRGMYNTFHADHPFLRYPLDHLFHSDDFALAGFERGPHTGSDHFPILASLMKTPAAAAVQEQKPADGSDREEAKEILREGPEE